MQVFPSWVYRQQSKNIKERSQKCVHRYHNKSIEQHDELVKKVKENPKTLFVIVADEAHVAPTKPTAAPIKPTQGQWSFLYILNVLSMFLFYIHF